MASENPNEKTPLYPPIDVTDLAENLFPDNAGDGHISPSAPPGGAEEVLITVPGAILHLIDKEYSVELACGDFSVVRLLQDEKVIAVYAVVADEIQWPLAKDEVAVKVDDSHYFFCIQVPKDSKEGSSSSSSSSSDSSDDDEDRDRHRYATTAESEEYGSSASAASVLSYGLTIASKGQEDRLRNLDKVLEKYCGSFSVHEVSEDAKKEGEALDGSVAMEISPADLKSEEKKDLMEERSAAYWTTLAPNVEDYNGMAAKLVAAGSGQLVKGILWCGDVTVDRLKWGNEFLKKKMTSSTNAEISPRTLKQIKRVKKVTKMTEKVANGVLCGVVKVSGFFASSVMNSKTGKKILKYIPEEVVLASLDGFSKVCDAVEVAGKNVMSTSSTVTTELVQHRYGDEAAKATSEGLCAAGHMVGAAWATFKIRDAFNPKSVLKSQALAKSAATELRKSELKKSKKKKKSK